MASEDEMELERFETELEVSLSPRRTCSHLQFIQALANPFYLQGALSPPLPSRRAHGPDLAQRGYFEQEEFIKYVPPPPLPH